MQLIKMSICALTATLFGCAGMQAPKDVGKPIEFTTDAPEHNQAEIFSSSKAWIAQTFVSGKAVTEDADKEAGRIIGNARIALPCSGMGCFTPKTLAFNMRIDIKDNKFKITFSNLLIEIPAGSGYPAMSNAIWNQADLDSATKGLSGLNDELKNYILQEKLKAKW